MFTISNDQEAPSTFHLMFFEVLNQVMFNIIILNCLYNFEKYLFLVEMNRGKYGYSYYLMKNVIQA